MLSTTNNRFDLGQGYSYDSSGNTTADAEGRTFVYDAENKQVELIESSVTVGEYFYDGDGKRVKKIAGSEETIFVHDAGGKLIGEYSSILQTGSNAKTVYTTNDHLGSPRINTDGTGQVISRHDYHPFGEEVSRSGYGSDTIRKQFTGYERDGETGLDFAQARYYSNSLGRFVVPDNFLNDTSAIDTQSWNLYAYVRNNPLYFVDPSGERIYVGKDRSDDRDDLLRRINFAYGCEGCAGVDENGYLTIDTTGLSADVLKATDFLTDAINTTKSYFAVEFTPDNPDVAFGRAGGTAVGVVNPDTGQKVSAIRIQLDFGDDKHVSGNADARASFLNLVFAHEVRHLHKTSASDPSGASGRTTRGTVVNDINEIRLARGLPLRTVYSATAAVADGVAELTFGRAGRYKKTGAVEYNSDGINALTETDKTIRWVAKNVGGKGIN